MLDPLMEKYAHLIVQHGLGGDLGGKVVKINASQLAQPLVLALYKELWLAGANPYAHHGFDGVTNLEMEIASDEQIGFIFPTEQVEIESIGAMINIAGGLNTRANTHLPPEKIFLMQKSREEISQRMMERINSKDVKWCIAQYPTDSAAQEAGMSRSAYERFVFEACLLDKPDPLAEWQAIEKKQSRLCEYLEGKKEFHVIAANTDLTVDCCGRKWVNCAGENNLPDGEVFTTPLETSARGRVSFSFPSNFMGRVLTGVWLEFRDGKIVDAGCDGDPAVLHKQLDLDEGARRLGEFAFGTNYGIKRYTLNMLFDEKIGGTMHMAFGFAPGETGGQNKSITHHDLLLDMREQGEVWADGELIYKSGNFVIQL
jgi:aminopeptidase